MGQRMAAVTILLLGRRFAVASRCTASSRPDGLSSFTENNATLLHMPLENFSSVLQDRFQRLGATRHTATPLGRPLRLLAWAGFAATVVWRHPLSQGRRTGALLRFFGWQLWRRFCQRGVEVSWSNGERLFLPEYSNLAGLIIACGTHEPVEHLFLYRLTRPGDEVIDVGANIGLYTLLLACEGARVYAFEPSTQARSVLTHNVMLNGVMSSVRVFPYALGETNGFAHLTTRFEGRNRIVDEREGTEQVEMITLDRWLLREGKNTRRVAFLKIDAEGYDEAVLRGGQTMLARDHPVVLIEVWGGGQSIRAFLARFGYRTYSFDPRHNRLTELTPDFASQANLIAVPDFILADVESRLREARLKQLGVPRVTWRPTTAPPTRYREDPVVKL